MSTIAAISLGRHFFFSLFSSTLVKVLIPGSGFMLNTRQSELLEKVQVSFHRITVLGGLLKTITH